MPTEKRFEPREPGQRGGLPGQTVRGGYLIARRHRETGVLIRIGSRPFEHGTIAEAKSQAAVLAEKHQDEFVVFCEVASVLPPDVEVIPEPVQEHTLVPPSPARAEPTPRTVIVEHRAPRRSKQRGRP